MYNMYFFFSGFFSLTVILRLIHVAYINSFISFYCLVLLCCIGISLSIHLLMDIWVVSSFWLSEIELLWHLCYKALCVYKCFYFFWVNVQEWNVCVYVCSTHPPPPPIFQILFISLNPGTGRRYMKVWDAKPRTV